MRKPIYLILAGTWLMFALAVIIQSHGNSSFGVGNPFVTVGSATKLLTGYLHIGTGTPSLAGADGTLYVTGRIETDNAINAASNINGASSIIAGVYLQSGVKSTVELAGITPGAKGQRYFNSTTSKPIWSTGTAVGQWAEADGTDFDGS